MAQTYSFLASIAQQVGLIYFMIAFFAVVVYALWPQNRIKFNDAADIPLKED